MNSPVLADGWPDTPWNRKLARARKHVFEFESLHSKVLESDPYRVAHRIENESYVYFFEFTRSPTPTSRLLLATSSTIFAAHSTTC